MMPDHRARVSWVAAAFVLLTLLGGCATYRAQPLSAPDTATAFSERSLDDPGLRDFMQTQLGESVSPWPLQRWTLDPLTLAALYYHPKLALARAQWASARAKAITAGAYPNPTLQFLPEYVTNPGAMSPWTIGLSVDVPIVTAGKRAYRTNEALDQAEAARLDVIQTGWQIRANVRQPLLKLDAAKRRRRLLDAQFKDAGALLAALKQRFSAGQASQYKVVQARLQWSNAQLALADAKAAERQARTALAGAVGVPVPALHGAQLDFAAMQKLPAFKSLPVARFKTYALTRRADIRAALMRYAASAQALKLEIARQYPNLNIGPGYQWDQGARRWSIGFSLSLPVFNQNQGPIAEARAQRQVLAARFRVLQEQITNRFESALAAYQSSRHKLALAQHLLSASNNRLASTRAAYRVGESNRVDLLRIRLETQNDRLALLKARVQAEKALAALEDTLEHPLQKPTATSHAIQNIAPRAPDTSPHPDAKSTAS